MDHEAKDAHHGGTAVVELDGTLGKLGLLIEGIPAEVEGAVAEIAGELGLAGDYEVLWVEYGWKFVYISPE